MIIVVEIIPLSGSPFDVTLDYKEFNRMGLDRGSWDCLPGRLSFSDGYFKIDRFDDLSLRAFDDSVSYWDTVKYILGAGSPDRAQVAGNLRDFGKWFDLANGQSGDGTANLHSGRFDFVTWRIKSGAPYTLLTETLPPLRP